MNTTQARAERLNTEARMARNEAHYLALSAAHFRGREAGQRLDAARRLDAKADRLESKARELLRHVAGRG